ncbi:hypothetical protein MMC10_000715 [Thelotrema lepadinum]|nr:hypothetical protein [Thelotrema lepadinum]
MILQLLLKRKNNALPQEEWDKFLKLQHHVDKIQQGAEKGNEYLRDILQNLQLMARAGKEYSGSNESEGLIETLVGRLLTNTQTLTTPLFTPLGLLLSLKTSILNHSCAPNTTITYSNRTISLRTIQPLEKDTELTISYIDTTLPVSTRQSELRNRYHFTCSCSQCSASQTLNHPDPHPLLGPLASTHSFLVELTQNVSEALAQARTLSARASLVHLAKAYQLFKPYPNFPPFLSPLQQLRLDLTISLMANGHWVPAFIQSLITRYESDPVLYPEEAHPARVARGWVHARLAGQVGHAANGVSSPSGGAEAGSEEVDCARALTTRFGLHWGSVIWSMVSGVSSKILKSHGVESGLSREVGREMGRLREEVKASGAKEPGKQDVEGVEKALKQVSKEGWEWWKTWEGNRRKEVKALMAPGGGEDGIGVLLD